MAYNWTAAENAIEAWFRTGSGIGNGKVVWANQAMPQVAMPYATLRISGVRKLGTTDEETQAYDGDADPGQEITTTIKGVREITVSCQVFAAPVTGSGTAREFAAAAQLALELPTVRFALNQAGLSISGVGAVQDISALFETKFQSRASLDVTMYLVDAISEQTGYIETVNTTGDTSA